MNFSVIIINFNTKLLTSNLIDSILRNSSFREIIIVDNSSTDGSAAYLREKYGSQVLVIENRENRGFGAANNQAAKRASGDILLFLNSDTIISSLHFFSEIEKLFLSDKSIGIISPKILLENGKIQPDSFGSFPSLKSLFLRKKSKANSLNEAMAVDWVTGAALAVRKEIFEKIHGFDEKFFMYFEDIDLCKRINDLGLKIYINPTISITHLCGKSISNFWQRKKHYYDSQTYYFRKHCNMTIYFIYKIFALPLKSIVRINIYCS